MAGGAAVHFVPLRVIQIMQQIFRQAGSKNGHSSWVSLGDAQAAAVSSEASAGAARGHAREMAFGAAKPAAVLSSWHSCFMKKTFALKIV